MDSYPWTFLCRSKGMALARYTGYLMTQTWPVTFAVRLMPYMDLVVARMNPICDKNNNKYIRKYKLKCDINLK